MRNGSLVRVLTTLLEASAGSRATLEGWARRRRVCARTIRRDFEALEAAGFAVCRTPESGPGAAHLWWIERVPRSISDRRYGLGC